MKHSENCTKLIKSFEGCKLTAYRDQVGVLTIGYGHTGYCGFAPIGEGDTIPQSIADSLLEDDLAKVDASLTSLITVPITQNQYDAIADFCFNLGVGAFKGSTLRSLLNQGAFEGASQQFIRWNHAGGVEVPGLTRRRQAEQDLFNTPA